LHFTVAKYYFEVLKKTLFQKATLVAHEYLPIPNLINLIFVHLRKFASSIIQIQ